MTKNINIGDRVQYILPMKNQNVPNPPYGATGTVVAAGRLLPGIIAVQWDTLPFVGHSCGGLCPDGTGWNVGAYDIEVIDDIASDESFSCIELLSN